MSDVDKGQITLLLSDWCRGDQRALNRLMPIVQAELRRLAGAYLRRERPDHTLQPTALVNEAYLRLIDQSRRKWQDRAQFFGIAAQVMRRILVDHARKHKAARRGGGRTRLALDEAIDAARQPDVDLVALDDALEALSKLDPRQCRVVELKFFGGMGVNEISEVLEISEATVKREWATAKVWLNHEIRRE